MDFEKPHSHKLFLSLNLLSLFKYGHTVLDYTFEGRTLWYPAGLLMGSRLVIFVINRTGKTTTFVSAMPTGQL